VVQIVVFQRMFESEADVYEWKLRTRAVLPKG
jgi:hypothetical protein